MGRSGKKMFFWLKEENRGKMWFLFYKNPIKNRLISNELYIEKKMVGIFDLKWDRSGKMWKGVYN